MGWKPVLVVGLVALLGAGAGVAGSALLIREGPPGPRGERGPRGTPGPSAEEALETAEDAQRRAVDASLEAGEVEEEVEREVIPAIDSLGEAIERERIERESVLCEHLDVCPIRGGRIR